MCEEMELLNGELGRLAHHDPLTGLPNRLLFLDRLTHAQAEARRRGERVAALCLDLDRFKEVNDTLGHAAGDQLLRTVGTRLGACLRESDTLARFGGDEFAIIQAPLAEPDDAAGLARRLIEALSEEFDLGGEAVRVGVSIGIAISDGMQTEAAQRLLQDADLALYRAKEAGGGQYAFFLPVMNERLRERRAVEAELRAALQNNDLFVHYQPQVDLRSGAVVGAEALVRWRRPGVGIIPARHFIRIAEVAGLIGAIGGLVLREACRQASTWPVGLHLAVNVSPVEFARPHFVESVTAALAEAGLDPGRLEIELTEDVLLREAAIVEAVFRQLRGLGVRLVLDDFGTGEATLGYLRKIRFDKIKIDRSFVRDLGEDEQALALVRAVVGFTDALDIGTHAAGVETTVQARLLLRQGCQQGQGFLYGRPMPPEEFRRLIDSQAVLMPLARVAADA
jgi:diguanylate cyclase (GGDEF)-like protein